MEATVYGKWNANSKVSYLTLNPLISSFVEGIRKYRSQISFPTFDQKLDFFRFIFHDSRVLESVRRSAARTLNFWIFTWKNENCFLSYIFNILQQNTEIVEFTRDTAILNLHFICHKQWLTTLKRYFRGYISVLRKTIQFLKSLI